MIRFHLRQTHESASQWDNRLESKLWQISGLGPSIKLNSLLGHAG
jgi:hypothetical protein